MIKKIKNLIKKLQIHHSWKQKEKSDTIRLKVEDYINNDTFKNIKWFSTVYGGYLPCFYIEDEGKEYIVELYTEFIPMKDDNKVKMNQYLNVKH